MDWLTDPQIWTALLTLTALEIVLGIDNVVFISILADKLPKNQREKARIVGLSLAAITRVLLLLSINWVIGLTDPIFEVFDREFSGRDLILLGGGIFLIYKATTEIHHKLEGSETQANVGKVTSFAAVIVQILLLDIVFSLDSVITAVGMADDVEVMIAAVLISIGVMLAFSGVLARFVNQHPSVKMLALSFLLLIGMSLVAEGFHQHIPKGYIYAAMGFSVFVEILNLRSNAHKEVKPVQLNQAHINEGAAVAAARIAKARIGAGGGQ